MKKILFYLFVLLTMLACTSCLEDKESSKIIGSISSETQGGNAETKTSDTKTEEKIPSVGEYIQGDVWKISLLSFKEYDKINADNTFNTQTAPNGKVYVVLFFEVENVSLKDDYFNYIYFESYIDGYSAECELLLCDVDGQNMISGDIAAGKKAKGYMAWLADISWKELEISYKDSLFGSGKSTFVVKSGDSSSSSAAPTHTEPSVSAVSTERPGIGEYIQGDTWKISLLSAKKRSSIPNDIQAFEQNAKEGKIFVIFFFEAENVSDKDDYFNFFYFEAYADGYKVDMKNLLGDVDGYSVISGDVAKGKKIKGFYACEVDIGWENLEISYKNGLCSNDKSTFYITQQDF